MAGNYGTTFGNSGYQGPQGSQGTTPTTPTNISLKTFTGTLTAGSNTITGISTTDMAKLSTKTVVTGFFGATYSSSAAITDIGKNKTSVTVNVLDGSGSPVLNLVTATGVVFNLYMEEDAWDAYTEPSLLPSSAGNGNLGHYAVALSSTTNGSRTFVVDTSFEPYRREAFRHRTIPAQRQSIQMTNIAGQGTVSTEGLWRREQVEWTMGAGQQYLDRKQDSQETRFLSSKGVDVFSMPLQATLLPDTYRKDGLATPNANIHLARCGDYVVYLNGTSVYSVLAARIWGAATTCTFDGTVNKTVSGVNNTTPTAFYDITSNDTYTFLATNTGIWFCPITTPSTTFTLYMANDVTTGYTGGYDMVKWVNDQLIASRKNRLYALQNRVASPGYPAYGSIPSIADTSVSINTITVSSTTATATTEKAHNLAIGQSIGISGSTTNVAITNIASASGIATVTTSSNHGLSIGQTVKISGNAYSAFNGTYTVKGVSSNTSFTYNTDAPGTVTAQTGGNTEGSGLYGFNTTWVVATTPTTTTFTFTVPSSYAAAATGGTALSSQIPDMLNTHQNPNWVWSDATSGMTQVYFAGYVQSPTTSKKYSGCIYRSDLMGASTTSSQGFISTTGTSIAQPFNLNTPIQALPMSPDEYPTCIQSYLNFIFVGTNRGIRMCQTLSIYDPTATATGDLKSGPLIPNILQPVTYPVTAIIGDGRYVWFSWNNYDTSSTGLGKLDLSTFVAGDPLSPAYASDLMVTYTGSYDANTGQGMINSLDWDPYDNVPLMAIGGAGIYAPYASNEGGNAKVYQYVPEGNITSGIFDYGIPDKKIPIYFDYGAICPVSTGTEVQALINIDPNDEDAAGYLALPAYPNGNTSATEVDVPQYHAEQFQVSINMFSDTHYNYTPILHRWTLKAWPAAVAGTQISVVVQLFSVNLVDGLEVFVDPYDSYAWLEQRRQDQEIMTYQEGPLSVQCIIDALDWLPHKRRGNYENGFEGDCVIYLKTISPYNYQPVTTIS